MPIIIRHNGPLNAFAEGVERGVQGYARSRAQVEQETRFREAAELAARRVAKEEETAALSRTALQQDITQQETLFNEQRALQEEARGVNSEAMQFLGGEDEIPEEELISRAAKIAAKMPAEHGARFLGEARSVLRRRVIDRGVQQQVDRIGALARPQAGPDGAQTPGVIDEGRAKGIAEMLQLYADSDGTEGMSPDQAEQAINAVVVEKANAQAQAAMWGKLQTEMGQQLAMVSAPGSGVPDDNIEEASTIIALAAIEPPKDAAGRKAIKDAVVKALYGGGAAAKAAAKSPVERAHERVMEEARAGFFTTKDTSGHGNLDVAKVRARERELVELYSSHRDIPFETKRASPGAAQQLPQSVPSAAPGAAEQPITPAKKRSMSRLESLRTKNLAGWASLIQDGAKVIASGTAEDWTKWLAENSLTEEDLSERDVAALEREVAAMRKRKPPKDKSDEQARERRNPAMKM